MPQNGIHGLVGMALARKLCPGIPVELRQSAALGIVMGAMIPDIDLYPASLVYLCHRPDLLYAIHRTFTHSLLAILLVAAAGWRLRRQSRLSWILRGAAVGMVSHSVLDIFFWFSAVDLFWPFSHFPAGHPLLPVIDLWKDFRLPPVLGNPYLLGNLLTAAETAASAVYLRQLRQVSHSERTRGGMRRWAQGMWAVFVVDVVGALQLDPTLETLLVMAPLLVLFLPYCWIATIQHYKRGG